MKNVEDDVIEWNGEIKSDQNYDEENEEGS